MTDLRGEVFSGFSVEQADAAAEAWGFNCGPASVCAVLEKTPDEIRPHLGDFEKKRYTNPTLMKSILRSTGARFRWRVLKGDCDSSDWPPLGLVRVQWDGPWCNDGVPIAARYRHTHWVGSRHHGDRPEVFDVNAIGYGGWISFREWSDDLVPWLIKEAEPKGYGGWWPTHSAEIAHEQ